MTDTSSSAKSNATPGSACSKCGAVVTDELPGGLCPACLMRIAQESQKEKSPTVDLGPMMHTPGIGRMNELFPELHVEQLIGKGGMGAVYRAKQKNLDRMVAIKVFLFKPNDPEFAERFSREAKALAKLNHPNIVTVHDFGKREDLHYLIMEYVDGVNLRDIVHEKHISTGQALEIVPQLCDALQFAHDHGVIHRDIKPENVLLDQSGRVKIADFGLAKMTGTQPDVSLTRTQQVMGTLNYMAPEQMERPTEVDHRADIYSLGVVIYELLTGELPIGVFQPPSRKVQVDVRMDEIVMRALEKEPDLRFQKASEIKTGVESVAHDHHARVQQGREAQTIPPVQQAVPVQNVPPQKPIQAAGFTQQDHSPYSDIDEHPRDENRSLVMMAIRFLGMACFLSCGMFFIAGSSSIGILERGLANFLGIAVAVLGAYLFACTGFLRRIFGMRPPESKTSEVKEFDSTSAIASFVRMIALGCLFSTGLVFIAKSQLDLSFRYSNFVAMALGMFGILLFVAAGQVDEYLGLNKKKKQR